MEVGDGPSLDALIAERLFQDAGTPVPPYSTDIEFAWRVVEKLSEQGWLVVVKQIPAGFPYRGEGEEVFPLQVAVELTWMPHATPADHRRRSLRPFALSDTAPAAICRCALEALEQLERYAEEG